MPAKLILKPAHYENADLIPAAEQLWELFINDDTLPCPYLIKRGPEQELRFLLALLDKIKYSLQFAKRSFYVIYDHFASGYLMNGKNEKRAKDIRYARKFNTAGAARMCSGIPPKIKRHGDLELIVVSFDEPIL